MIYLVGLALDNSFAFVAAYRASGAFALLECDPNQVLRRSPKISAPFPKHESGMKEVS
jgi:hypothetical protein